jgi:lipid-A-disaccharide synthase
LSYIGLPNIIAGYQVIPELLQEAVTPMAIRNKICRIIDDGEYTKKMKRELLDVRHKLGDFGAVNRVASLILQFQKGN